MKLLFILLLSPLHVWSFSITESNVCPVKFEATVRSIDDVDRVEHALSKLSIHFDEVDPIKGDFKENERIEILKHGLFKLDIGKRYSIELNNGKVCLIQEV